MPRQKQEPTERLRPKSQTNRLYWHPGEPHSLDSLKQEVEQVDQLVPDQIQSLLSKAKLTQERLNALLSSEQYQEDTTTPFKAADQQANQIVEKRFGNRKHLQHLQWFFALLRRKRLLGRLQAIEAALDLVNGLLLTEETLTQEFLTALQTHEETPPIRTPLTREEERLQGIGEPLTLIIPSAKQSRQLLTHFEKRLPDLRRHLSLYSGWFEVFYVPKRHYKPTLIAYAESLEQEQKQKIPIPEAVTQALHPEVVGYLRLGIMPKDMPKALSDEIYDIIEEGPYVRYRWREQKHIYTISLGLLDDYPPYPFVPSGF
jgi:hypothetical protein